MYKLISYLIDNMSYSESPNTEPNCNGSQDANIKPKCNMLIFEEDGQTYVRLPNCEVNPLQDGLTCFKNPDKCYRRLRDEYGNSTSFYETTTAIIVHKKTRPPEFSGYTDVLTTLILPTGTNIHSRGLNKIDTNLFDRKCRADEAYVYSQYFFTRPNINLFGKRYVGVWYGLWSKQAEISYATSNSGEMNFKYENNELVEPSKPFYSLNDKQRDNKSDATCESGIHYFHDIHDAERYC